VLSCDTVTFTEFHVSPAEGDVSASMERRPHGDTSASSSDLGSGLNEGSFWTTDSSGMFVSHVATEEEEEE